MFSITLKRSVTALAVMAGLLAVAGPAGASSVLRDYDEVAVEGFMDYTDDALAFSGDAYVNEMGVTVAGDDVRAFPSLNPAKRFV